MELVGCLLLFFLLWRLVDHRRFRAQVFLAYVMGYAVVRGIVEIWRAGFTADYFLGSLTQAQALSIALFLVTLVPYLMLSRRAPREA
jgi:phosphatidylglycerol:prolipoprotein diacylglycerol transferase